MFLGFEGLPTLNIPTSLLGRRADNLVDSVCAGALPALPRRYRAFHAGQDWSTGRQSRFYTRLERAVWGGEGQSSVRFLLEVCMFVCC